MKKTTSIAVHMSETRRVQLKRFAEREGMSESEYVHRLIEKHIKEKVDEMTLLLEILGDQRSVSSLSSGSTQE